MSRVFFDFSLFKHNKMTKLPLIEKKILNWHLRALSYFHLVFLVIIKLIEMQFGILINIKYY